MTPLSEFGKWSPDPVRRRKAAWELVALIVAYAVVFLGVTELIGFLFGLTAGRLFLILVGTVQAIGIRLVSGRGAS